MVRFIHDQHIHRVGAGLRDRGDRRDGSSGASACAAPPPLAPTLKAGDVAPAFALQGSDGKVHRLADYKGKTVIVAWFPKAFTGG
jgi:AhpC/TSA family